MQNLCIYPAGHTAALTFARQALAEAGYPLTDKPQKATHLLLPVPSFDTDGCIKGGAPVQELLQKLPRDITVIGGNLNHPALSTYKTIDLLRDPLYTAQNAHLTAICALQLAMDQLPVVLTGLPVLVIGWGRIGKCLASLLRRLGADVSVAARKESDRAMLEALGYRALDTASLDTTSYRLIFNTVPVMLLPQCAGSGLKIDLASQLGLGGLDVVWAKGLPGRYAPESSGKLIAHTLIRILQQEESL